MILLAHGEHVNVNGRSSGFIRNASEKLPQVFWMNSRNSETFLRFAYHPTWTACARACGCRRACTQRRRWMVGKRNSRSYDRYRSRSMVAAHYRYSGTKKLVLSPDRGYFCSIDAYPMGICDEVARNRCARFRKDRRTPLTW